MRRRFRCVPTVGALALIACVALPRLASAQSCTPASCASEFHVVDFEAQSPGTSVEGLGAVDPLLDIASVAWPFGPTCTPGSAKVIAAGNPFPYSAYSTNASIVNGCLGGSHGFADDAECVLDYDFTFVSGISVTCFSIRMLDYGDYFPLGGATHQVTLTGYDATNAIVDQDVLSTSGGVQLGAGDACTSQAGEPGDVRLTVAGSGIVRVTLRFDAAPDPNIGFDEIAFCAVGVTGARPASWGRIKTLYR
jgi:hypothetical protein